jgi:hypothetical protein
MPGLTHSEALHAVASANGANWTANVVGYGTLPMVDDLMLDHDNTVVFSNVVGAFDLYEMSQPVYTRTGIKMVQAVSNARVIPGGSGRSLGQFLYADGDWVWRGRYFWILPTPIPWAPTYHLAYVTQHAVNPATGVPWTYPFTAWIGHQVAG